MCTRILLALAILPFTGACFGPPSLALVEEGRAVAAGRINPRDLSGRELKSAYRGFHAYLSHTKQLELKHKIAEGGVRQFGGTPYEAHVRRSAAELRDALMVAEFRKRVFPWGWWRLRRTEYIRLLEDAKPHFAGTKYADMIDKAIDHCRREIEKGNDSRVGGDG